MSKKIKVLLPLIIIMFLVSGFAYSIDGSTYTDKIGLFQDIRLEQGRSIFGDMVAIFGNVTVDGSANGDVVSIFGDVTVNGSAGGEAISVFGSVRVNGSINGDAIAVFGGVDMGSNSNINGSRIQIFGGGLNTPQSARINGDNYQLPIFTGSIDIGGVALFLTIMTILGSVVSIGLSFVLVGVMPQRMDNITTEYNVNMLRKLGLGLLLYAIYTVTLTILGAIIIGIPLIPVVLVAMGIIGFGGKTSVRMFIGRKIKGDREWSIYKELFIGSLVYLLIDITVVLKPVLYIGILSTSSISL